MSRIFTEEQLSEHLGIAGETLAYWRRQGTGPRWFRAGKYPRYREAAVEEWARAEEDKQAQRRSA